MKNKKIIVLGVILLLIVILSIIGIRIYSLQEDLQDNFSKKEKKENSLIVQYSEQAIKILKDYKKYKITSEEAHTQIERLSNQVHKEYQKDKDEDNAISWLSFDVTLQSLSWDLVKDSNSFNSDSLTISEIDEYIDKIQNLVK